MRQIDIKMHTDMSFSSFVCDLQQVWGSQVHTGPVFATVAAHVIRWAHPSLDAASKTDLRGSQSLSE